jgi:HSP20 family protein
MSNNLLQRSPKFLPVQNFISSKPGLYPDDNLLDIFLFNSTSRQAFEPRVNLSEDNAAFYIEAEMAGVKPEDIKLQCNCNALLIRAKRKNLARLKKKNYHRIEYSYGEILRSFAIPLNADIDNMDAVIKDGILTITLPKIMIINS